MFLNIPIDIRDFIGGWTEERVQQVHFLCEKYYNLYIDYCQYKHDIC